MPLYYCTLSLVKEPGLVPGLMLKAHHLPITSGLSALILTQMEENPFTKHSSLQSAKAHSINLLLIHFQSSGKPFQNQHLAYTSAAQNSPAGVCVLVRRWVLVGKKRLMHALRAGILAWLHRYLQAPYLT